MQTQKQWLQEENWPHRHRHFRLHSGIPVPVPPPTHPKSALDIGEPQEKIGREGEEKERKMEVLALTGCLGLTQPHISVFWICLLQNFIQTRTRNERYWIGLHDQHSEGEWKWLDGSNYRTGFKNWKQGEPNSYQNQDEDCGQLWINGEWNDYTCSSESFYVCEKALPVKPTPASKRT
uniref:C-type lectin domain-containing protein n=1 Tax=Podarcis muralis TaxID=64176 RepID=A0A670IHJ7_PODMU